MKPPNETQAITAKEITRNSQTLNQDPIYFFHIPKTAGTTFNTILKHHFPKEKICEAHHWSQLIKIPKERINEFDLYIGHFYSWLPNLITSNPRWIVMFRDPVERALSHYAHILNDPAHYFHTKAHELGSLMAFMRDPEMRHTVSNFQVRSLALDLDPLKTALTLTSNELQHFKLEQILETWPLPHDGETLLQIARRRLEKFQFIGITECFKDSANLLCRIFNWPPQTNFAAQNTNPKRIQWDDLTREEKITLLNLNKFDIALYQDALEIFKRQFLISFSRDPVQDLEIPLYEINPILNSKQEKNQIVSYAQNFEDVMLWRALRDVEAGFYVDVGANDPSDDSVTRLFYDRGWRGINVEPSTEFLQRLRAQRPRDINLGCAVGDEDGEILFYETSTRGWSTSDTKIGEHYATSGEARRQVVELQRLDTILERYGPAQIHFLKIDVEGAEAAVLRGLTLSRFRPWVLVVEALDPITKEPRFAEWEAEVLANGYHFAYFDGLNRFYVAGEHAELLASLTTPPNVLDQFLTSRLADAQERAASLALDQEQLRSRLADMTRERDAMVASLSWRLTAPLRRTNALRMQARSALRQLSKRAILRTIARVGCFLDRRPSVKSLAGRTLRRMPGVDRLVRRALAAHRSGINQNTGAVLIPDLADAAITQDPEDQIALPLPAGKREIYIYVDHTIRCSTNTGVQRVVRGIARSLMEAGERVRFVKWNAVIQQCVLINLSEREYLSKWNGPGVTDDERAIYPAADEQQIPVAPRPTGENNWLVVPEVTHITFQAQPVTLDLLMWSRHAGLKSGFVFYDAIPLRRQEFSDMAGKHAEYMQQLLLADVVWPISDWAGDDLKAFWTVNQLATDKTMPHVATQHLAGESQTHARATQLGHEEPLILCVGTIEPRKNQLQLIHAFQAFRQRHPDSAWRLVLVGNLHPTVADAVEQAARADNAIRHLGHVDDADLHELYRTCAFTVFPSVDEGFGLPILESLWYGKPCLCANFGSMAEVARDGGCLMVDTAVQADLQSGLERLITDAGLREHLARQAHVRPIRTWGDYAAALRANFDAEGNPARNIGLVYYWVDSTVQFPKNTGIQRVTRQLARALMENGLRLVPVKVNPASGTLMPPDAQELDFLSRWNGPPPDRWHAWVEPASAGSDAWFFMPELPLNRSGAERTRILASVRGSGLRTAAVFYDAIPWKMRQIYPESFAMAHREYMLELSVYDLVLPISLYAREDLVDFLGAELPRPQSLDDKVIAVQLPGEFPESARVQNPTPGDDAPIHILSVGTVEPRKNHETLLRAFAQARQSSGLDLRLTIAGGSHSIEPALADRVRAFIADHPAVTWEEHADDARLRDLYLRSALTVYPTIEEGFGLPILESLWYGKPCICAGFGAMKEVAAGGGCLMVDVRDARALAEAIAKLAKNRELRGQLVSEATTRRFKSWRDYGLEVALRMSQSWAGHEAVAAAVTQTVDVERAHAMRLPPRPKLSVCISTYNRAEWLAVSLRNWAQQYPEPIPDVELVVCDNASTDHTPQVVEPYLSRNDFRYKRNAKNVGMLGNLRETAHHANGEYVWIIGDDDLLMPGAVRRVLDAIRKNPGIALVYLNYAYTREEDPHKVVDFKTFFAQATPIVPADEDQRGPIRTICAHNENFFTAIYTLVLRRDHALRAYSQDTSGRPFSSMLTCIPTTHYVLNHMMEEPGLWIGEPQLVVNLNVSWIRYAPLWILERVPEMYELAERRGVLPEEMDRWRRHTWPGVVHYFQEILDHDPLGNSQYFSAARLIRRFKHLPEFAQSEPILRERYSRAHAEGHPAAAKPLPRVFPQAAE